MFDEVGVEFVTLGFNPAEKNHQGFNLKDKEHDQRLYGTGAPNCPLLSLKKYLNLLHPECPFFFQQPKDGTIEGSSRWYKNSPVGVNKISGFMQRISEKAGLATTYTNHSIRATTVTSLRNKGIHVNDIMAVTGHKCLQSIMSYSTTTETARRQMSHALATVSGYDVTTASPRKPSKPSAALGKPPLSPPSDVKPALPRPGKIVDSKEKPGIVSTPKKATSIALHISPNKNDMALLVQPGLSYDIDNSPNKIPCSQVVKSD